MNVFTRIRMASCQGGYAIWCASFYVKLACVNELYLTLQADFAACCCFWFSANDSSVKEVCPPLVYNIYSLCNRVIIC